MKSKSITVFIIFSILFSGILSAQSFDKGNNVLGLAIGIGGHYGVYNSYSSQTPAIGIMYEKGMQWEAGPGIIGMGGYLGYKSLSYKSSVPYYEYDYSWTYFILGVRGAYHYEFADNLDTYGGLLLSYNGVSFKDKTVYPYGYGYTGSAGSGIGLSLYLGGRYYFSDQWAALLELGYGITYLQLGAAYKF